MYGAVLATIVAGWSIYQALTDRGKLRVSARLHGHIFTIAITNVGRKTIWVAEISCELRNRPATLFAISNLPVSLEPGQTFDASTDAKFFDAPPTRISATDSLGKVYRLSRLEMKALEKHYFRPA